jgi:hypothetical protein
MTEAEWMACTDPTPMLEFLRPKVTERKLRLFAVACCRRIWEILPDEECRSALETAEQFAEGLASGTSLDAARRAALRSFYEFTDSENGNFTGRESAAAAVAGACWTEAEGLDQGLDDVIDNCYGLGPLSTGLENGGQIEYLRECHDIRDIFGNPFHALNLDSTWIVPEVRTVAQAIYDTLAFDRMHELAEVLQRVGCDDLVLLDHCFRTEQHVRGCWAVDVVLGKT